jgi:uncharacterized membrane protein YhaH (DUF805 family)
MKSTPVGDKKQRINRETYLASVVIHNVFVPILFFFVVMAMLIGSTAVNTSAGASFAQGLLMIAFFIYWFLTFLRACVYRCFDIGITQFFVLLLIVPFLNIPVFLYLCFKGSEPKANERGHVPQGLQLKRTLPFIRQ